MEKTYSETEQNMSEKQGKGNGYISNITPDFYENK
jgi:hypothetical protein